MSVTAIPAARSRHRARAVARPNDAIAPARGVMVGLGLSALIWTGVGALLLG